MLKLILGAQSNAVKEAAARDRPLAADYERKFRAAASKSGVDADWQVGEGNSSDILTLAGRYFDLIIVEKTMFAVDEIGRDVAEKCAFQGGRPVIIMPRYQSVASIGKRIVIGWNASRQAAAAVQGALPLITRAEAVTVLKGPDKDVFPNVTRWPKLDIESYLERHGARVRVAPFEASYADARVKLIDAAKQADADLLVMGAYGRSAWREFIFGGATRDVLKSAPLPVLMAH